MKQQLLPHLREPVAPMKAGQIGPFLKLAHIAHCIINGEVKKMHSFNLSNLLVMMRLLGRQGILWRKLRDSPSTMYFKELVGATCHVGFSFNQKNNLYLSHPPRCQAKSRPGASIGASSQL